MSTSHEAPFRSAAGSTAAQAPLTACLANVPLTMAVPADAPPPYAVTYCQQPVVATTYERQLDTAYAFIGRLHQTCSYTRREVSCD